MGFGKSLKKAFVRPIKAVDNKVIPVVNKINSYLDVWVSIIYLLLYKVYILYILWYKLRIN